MNFNDDKFDLEIRVAKQGVGKDAGGAAVTVDTVHRADLVGTLLSTVAALATLNGEKLPEPDTTAANALVTGQNVEVRLGTTALGQPVVRRGQVVADVTAPAAAQNRKLMIRLIAPFTDYELAALENAYTLTQKASTAEQVRQRLLAMFAKAADLPVPSTPNEEAETERALVTALRNWRSTRRVNGTLDESAEWAIDQVRHAMLIVGARGTTHEQADNALIEIAELVGLTVDRGEHETLFSVPADAKKAPSVPDRIRDILVGAIDGESEGSADAEKLAGIAELLGMRVVRDSPGGLPIGIHEPRPVTP